jgi:hypothetical protein
MATYRTQCRQCSIQYLLVELRKNCGLLVRFFARSEVCVNIQIERQLVLCRLIFGLRKKLFKRANQPTYQ